MTRSRRREWFLPVVAVGLACSALVSSTSVAAPNDLYLIGLVDENGTPDHNGFRKLVGELGLVMTPLPLQPAETTGQAGFDFGVDVGVHGIAFQEDYWVKGRVGTGVENRPALVPTLETLGFRGRKGFIFPLPLTSEVEVGAMWIVESSLVVVNTKLRLALNEGIRYLPDVAVSVGVNRLLNAGDLDLTTVTTGAQISKSFGILGDVALTPFLGWESIFIHGTTRILDPTPLNTSDVGNTLTLGPAPAFDFGDQGPGACLNTPLSCARLNRADRISVGVRVRVAVVQVAVGVDVNVVPERDFPVFFQGGTRLGVVF